MDDDKVYIKIKKSFIHFKFNIIGASRQYKLLTLVLSKHFCTMGMHTLFETTALLSLY